ncbi:hypothetical protein TruAng_009084 [Truncatella angustata]|nr:hypothetical protein TruAng_009084 [Truncatella angustata]
MASTLQPSTQVGQLPRARWTKFGELALGANSTAPEEAREVGPRLNYSLLSISPSASDATPAGLDIQSKSESGPDPTFRPASTSDDFQVSTLVGNAFDTSNVETSLGMPASKTLVIELPQSTLINPRSLFSGFEPDAPTLKEAEAVSTLLQILKHQNHDLGDFIEFELSNFTIYIDSVLYPSELRPLQHLATRAASDKFFFDGILGVGDKKYFVKRVPFRELPIGNYCDVEEHSVGDQVWIRSEVNQNDEVYYKLGRPSPEYERFWVPFLWIANLTKHVVDYCFYLLKKRRRARLEDFRSDFAAYITSRHKRSPAFQQWYRAHHSHDFRAAIVANIGFIWKEAFGLPLPDRNIASWHDFWGEIKGNAYTPMIPASGPIPDGERMAEDSTTSDGGTKHKQKTTDKETVAKTIVTPYIYDLFSHMGLSAIMKPVTPTDTVHIDNLQQIRITSTRQQRFHQGSNRSRDDEDFLLKIEAGDLISTPPDHENTGTKWKRETSKHHDSDHVWYGMVQLVHISPQGRRSFDVIWMYQARDTPCALMKYPWSNELFLSDTCTCETARVEEEEVLGTHRVAWFGNPTSTISDNLFVRQTYLAGERCWVALDEDHLTCNHHNKIKHTGSERKYQLGDTVLVKLPKSDRLDALVVERIYKGNRKRWVRLRQLLRRNEMDSTKSYRPNELVYSDQLVEIEVDRIARRCLVRAFMPAEEIPCPYDRGGTGDVFYITHRTGKNGQLVPIEDPDCLDIRQGFQPSVTPSIGKLRGLDLFCGGGNFGRGIEDGGAVSMNWTNDISSNAIHSYMANCDRSICKPYLGSIDDLLEWALNGNVGVPKPGDVQFISGGSPCQGFSRLTKAEDQKTLKQYKNRSLVASFASFVDLYRPQYGLLENVGSMVKAQDKREDCFFSQIVCAIVGLGYQVRIVYAGAWTYGAPQMRSRVFLSFAAPGVKMPKAPRPTHCHPPGTMMGTLGKMSNGQPFGERVRLPTPFKFMSALEATEDLPDIRDAKVDYCIGFPDHRISIGCTPRIRGQMFQIPIQPYGMTFAKTFFGYEKDGIRVAGAISTADRDFFFPNPKEQRMQPGSKGWGRVHPHSLFRTVVTRCGPTDNRTGIVNHWHQPRPLTLLEVRRAQGFLDHEVITGTPSQQWHIVGNSVARQVALALGLTIREAWFGTLYDQPLPDSITKGAPGDFLGITENIPNSERLGQIFEIEGMLQGYHYPSSEIMNDPISTPETSVGDPLEGRLKSLGQKRVRLKRLKSLLAPRGMPVKKLRMV